jgi:hypothetical protein
MVQEYWNLGEEQSATKQWPRNSVQCLGKITRALVELNGQMLSSHILQSGYSEGREPIIMRISLPVGQKEKFEQLVGFPLTKPDEVEI